MVLYGYTIGDADINATRAGEQFAVYRFPIGPFNATPQKVGEINAANIPNADLEGLGTNPTTGRVSAINEPRASGSTTAGSVIAVTNVDQPFAPVSVSRTPTLSDLRRFGFDSGADFGRDFSAVGQPIVGYNISGSNGTSVGSSLYKSSTPPGAISLVDGFGAPTTAAQRQGTQATNPGKFADGLAIDNLNPGRTRALASDFSTADGDGNQLYKVDLLTGQLSAPIALRTPSGQALNVNADSGLAFTNSGSQRLLALLETGAVYEITGYQDELAASGLGSATRVNGDGFATATLLGTVPLPGAASGAIDYEGFTIVNE